MTASSSGCTPLFLKLEPHSTGVSAMSSVALRIAALRLDTGISWSSRIISSSSSSKWETSSSRCSRAAAACLDEFSRDLDDLLLLAELILVDDRVARDQVDDPPEVPLRADRQLDRDGIGAEPVDHRLNAALEVGADPVHLVDVGDPWNRVLVGLTPDRL